ncbi:MAG: hypothetical protein NC177_17790 [Ruminococcus flavefaciens]|nr:hypothetical protein [Ruminococcus flavefaciens]
MWGMKPELIEFLTSEPVEELCNKSYEISGQNHPFCNDCYQSIEDYINKLIEYAKVDWKFKIIKTSNPPKIELKLYK